jgi:DNA-binding MarR family transcriptional regulator
MKGPVNGPDRACRNTNRPGAGESGDDSGLECRTTIPTEDSKGVAMEKNRTGAVSAATAASSPSVSIPEALGSHVCFLLGTVSTRAIELFGQELTGSKLSVRAAGMLLLLDAQGPTSQNVIGQQMRLERSTMSLAVDELERNRLVRRRRAPADRRQNELELTARGRRAIDEIQAATDKTTESLLQQLDPDEQRQLVALLQRILH